MNFIKINKQLTVMLLFLGFGLQSCKKNQSDRVAVIKEEAFPNIILVMADDLGWGDVAYNGNPIVKTPHLDVMSKSGLKLNRFYAAAPVCSPTRASCLTGRHPYRVKIPWAGDGFIAESEVTLAEALKTKGYATGHFGKWHVGGLSKTVKQSYFPGPPTTYSPPWENGFDVSFSTESMMPTYNPYYQIGGDFGTKDYQYIQSSSVLHGQKVNGFKWRDYYWIGDGTYVEGLEGDDATIIMDRALKFIEDQVENKKQFLSVIWFHNVHTPVVAGSEHRSHYSDLSLEEQHWYGAITAMDDQIGRLRKRLKELNISDDTIVWFCSDNGPSYIHNYNSAGPHRGKKSELYEGGIIVPSIIEWPEKLNGNMEIDVPMVTSDFYPTFLNLCGIDIDKQPVIDGENVLPILMGNQRKRNAPIGFRSPLPNRLKKQEVQDAEQLAFIGDQYKLLTMDNRETYQLYDLKNDVGETIDLSNDLPGIKKQLLDQLLAWSVTIDNENK